MNEIKQTVIPFLTFNGIAKEAMDYYVSIFPEGKVLDLAYFDDNERGEVGKVMNGTFEVMGIVMMVMDMKKEYCPEFSWATTLLLNCRTETEFDHLFTTLSSEGQVMMGPEEVLNLRKVAWVTDRFGVTWQLVWQ